MAAVKAMHSTVHLKFFNYSAASQMSLLYLCTDLVYELLYLIVGKVDTFLLQQFFDA